MRARKPKFDFSNSRTHWAADPDFAQFVNSASVGVPYLERFLNRVMAKAATMLKDESGGNEELRENIRIFIRQEANHYTTHDNFNAIMARDGYDMAPLQAFIVSEYERLFRTKSIAFCLAYCEGFETIGPPLAHVWLDQIEDLLQGADPEIVAMWKWHLMEEFEHRTVCYDTFHALHGGYFMRMYGFLYAQWHLKKISGMARNVLFSKDRAGMSAHQLKESKRREKNARRRMDGPLKRALLRVYLPSYSPRWLPEPHSFSSILTQMEQRV